MSNTSPITTHVLDTMLGRPAAGLAVSLSRFDEGGQWQQLAEGETNADGRLMNLLAGGEIAPGRYCLQFDTAEYFQSKSQSTIYPVVAIEFVVGKPDEHYHIPLLLSPFGYTTYRGS